MVTGYVLIGCSPGEAKQVSEALLTIKGNNGESKVLQADPVTGEYDVIALLQASDLDAMTDLIMSGVQSVGGVKRTTTCLAVKLGGT